MAEYCYKGFKISYHICINDHKLYKADGTVYCQRQPKSWPPVKFHTEYNTSNGAEQEIKKLLEHYVDFELNNDHKMKQEWR